MVLLLGPVTVPWWVKEKKIIWVTNKIPWHYYCWLVVVVFFYCIIKRLRLYHGFWTYKSFEAPWKYSDMFTLLCKSGVNKSLN